MHFNLLTIELGVDQPQQSHTDLIPSFELGANTEHFYVVELPAIDKYSFLYFQPINVESFIVLVNKGDTLLIRHDIRHAGVENVTERKNMRLH